MRQVSVLVYVSDLRGNADTPSVTLLGHKYEFTSISVCSLNLSAADVQCQSEGIAVEVFGNVHGSRALDLSNRKRG